MELNLKLLYQQQNDNKAIILSDITDNYNKEYDTFGTGTTLVDATMYEIRNVGSSMDFTDPQFGADISTANRRFITDAGFGSLDIVDNAAVQEVSPKPAQANELTTLTLGVKFTGTSMVEEDLTPTAPLDLFVLFPGITNQSEMLYVLTSDILFGTPDQLIPDGLYEFEYTVSYRAYNPAFTVNEITQVLNTTILVYGQVKVCVYNKFRLIPAWCNCKDQNALHYILETDLCGAYLSAIEASAYIAKTEELLNMLIVLDDMCKNGSKLTF